MWISHWAFTLVQVLLAICITQSLENIASEDLFTYTFLFSFAPTHHVSNKFVCKTEELHWLFFKSSQKYFEAPINGTVECWVFYNSATAESCLYHRFALGLQDKQREYL